MVVNWPRERSHGYVKVLKYFITYPNICKIIFSCIVIRGFHVNYTIVIFTSKSLLHTSFLLEIRHRTCLFFLLLDKKYSLHHGESNVRIKAANPPWYLFALSPKICFVIFSRFRRRYALYEDLYSAFIKYLSRLASAVSIWIRVEKVARVPGKPWKILLVISFWKIMPLSKSQI